MKCARIQNSHAIIRANLSIGDGMAHFDEVRTILGNSLQLGNRIQAMTPETHLLGSLPELDSMAVVNLIAALEDHFGFIVDDDEISAEVFATLASLDDFVTQKLSS